MTKRKQALAKSYDAVKQYTLDEGMAVSKKCATAKFDETIELHVRLGVDPKQADQQVRGTIGLPHGLGQSRAHQGKWDAVQQQRQDQVRESI